MVRIQEIKEYKLTLTKEEAVNMVYIMNLYQPNNTLEKKIEDEMVELKKSVIGNISVFIAPIN